MSRRQFLLAAQAALIAAARPELSLAAQPDNYPSRPVRVVVPWPPGHTADIVARLATAKLQASTGQSFFVENVAGAAGVIGTSAVFKAQPDGYTILITSGGPILLAPLFFPKEIVAYEPVKDFLPISIMGWFGSVLVTKPDFPASTLPEAVAYLKANPGKVSFSSTGVTSFNRLQMELFMRRTGTKMTHVPYRGETAQLTDLMSGVVDIGFSGVPSSAPLIKSNKLKPLAVGTPERHVLIPAVPTFKETGVASLSGFADSGGRTWVGMLVSSKVPLRVAARLNYEMNKVVQSDDFKSALVQQGLVPAAAVTPDEFKAVMVQNIATWKKVAAEAKVRPE